jgi:ABC-type multidrug transport system fused ATPase/permease subunit
MFKKLHDIYGKALYLIFALIIIVSLINTLFGYLSGVLVASVVDDVIEMGIVAGLYNNIQLILLYIFILSLTFGLNYLKSVNLSNKNLDAQVTILSRIFKIDYNDIKDSHSGNYYSILTSDLPLFLSIIGQIDSIFATVSTSLGSILFIFTLDYKIGLILTGVGLLIVFYNQVLSPKFREYQRKIQINNKNINKISIERFRNYLEMRFYNYGFIKRRHNDEYDLYNRENMRRVKFVLITMIIGYLLGFAQTYLPLFSMGVFSETHSTGDILAILNHIVAFMLIFRGIGRMISSMQGPIAGAERLYSVLSLVPLQKRNNNVVINNDEIKIENLHYEYTEETDFNIHINEYCIKKNQSIGVVGERGSGKSTFLKILSGLLRNYTGTVLLYGNDMQFLNEKEIANHIAYIPQSFPVFNGSIKENFSIANSTADKDEIENVLRLVNIWDEICSLREGLNTNINDNVISVGQRQRICIAMALLRKKDILILDEPVSALDIENSHNIEMILKRISENSTVIASSHEKQLLKTFDEIITFKNGRIVERIIN